MKKDIEQLKRKAIEEFDKFMIDEYGKWKIGRAEAKSFLLSKLSEIENLLSLLDELEKAVREEVIEKLKEIENNSDIKNYQSRWELLKEFLTPNK